MAKLTLFITEHVTPGLRGELTRWMLELKPGVFIGAISSLVGEQLWAKIIKKSPNGGSIWIKSMNTEQKFEIQAQGEISRIIRDFEGLQLITIPKKIIPDNRMSNIINTPNEICNSFLSNHLVPNNISQNIMIESSKSSFQLTNKNHTPVDQPSKLPSSKTTTHTKFQKIPQIPIEMVIHWDTQGLHENFIVRSALFSLTSAGIFSKFDGQSAYWEFPPESLWFSPYSTDLEGNVHIFLKWLYSQFQHKLNTFWGKKIVSLDIETTDYIPKAREGFVNILGLCILDLRKYPPITQTSSLNNIEMSPSQNSSLSLEFYQIFNMERKKQFVPYLLTKSYPFLKDVDLLLVFNRDFDIEILQKVISEFKLQIELPINIYDLKTDFPSLHDLEKDLLLKLSWARHTSEKGKISEYYHKFKGNSQGYEKQIEPIGTYNLFDCFSPLFGYLMKQ